jgi:DNA-binding NarL/FixJ family response regulator
MREQVHRVLFVSSLYESFILAEDGQLHERVMGEFLASSLLQPPDLMRVSSGAEALALLRRRRPRVDLVIASPQVGDMDAGALARAIHSEGLEVPVVVLGYTEAGVAPFARPDGRGEVFGAFLWQGDARILLAIVKAVEDRLNAPLDAGLGVPVVLVVEDSIRYASSFLPVVYAEVLNLSRAVLAEAGNRLQQMLRLRARPKILLSRSFEEAFRDFKDYRQTVMGVISDVEFPRGGEATATAGVEFTEAIRALQPDVPIILQSSRIENRAIARRIGTDFLLKGAPDFLARLREALTERLFFGDFVFRDPRDGSELIRAADLRSLVECLETIPDASLAFHAGRNDFSRWLRARAEFGLADTLRPRRLEDFPTLADLRAELVGAIDGFRRERNRGTVSVFRADLFDGEEGLVQIGGGSLGGKGRGLAFASRLMDEVRLSNRFPDLRIRVPPAVVLGTEVFERFMAQADLHLSALQSDAEEITRARILASALPDDVREALRAVTRVVDRPLAVRSSSLLEDSPSHSFAGVYSTWLIPNVDPDPVKRAEQLEAAVKRVYASTFTKRSRAFLEATPFRLEEEAMAVIIQRVVGRRHGDHFYPDFAGVARSHNYYPTPPAQSQDGVCAVALGLGKTVSEGEPCLRFAPPYPEHILEMSSVEAMLDASQRDFWALDLSAAPPADGWPVDGPLTRLDLADAEAHGTLTAVASTYSAANERIYDGLGRPGVRLVSFAPMLKHRVFPLSDVVQELLILGMAGTRMPVEIEFAVDLAPEDGGPPEVGFLQLRPLAALSQGDVDIPDADPSTILCETPLALGNGRFDDLFDIVVVDPERFDRSRSRETARHVAEMNQELVRAGRPYLLVGVGRWGSSEPWLGIPVAWEDIAGARVIVEAGLRDLRVTPSQGTHFFQNLVSLNLGFFTVNEAVGEGRVAWSWLMDLPPTREKGAVRHLRLERPLRAFVDGRSRHGIILKPEPGPWAASGNGEALPRDRQ